MNKSSRYLFPKDLKIPEDILSSSLNASLSFERTNIMDFWLVGFAIVETGDTSSKNFVGWLKNDKNGSWYQHLCSATLMPILKYSMLSIGIPKDNVYKLIILKMICPVFTFSLTI